MEQLKKKYEAQADLMGSKSRFGFFSIPPSHTAAKTDFSRTNCKKTSEGKVFTQSRNIFSGPTSSGMGRKSYFSVPKSIYQGDPYDKVNSCNKKKQQQQTNKKVETTEKEVFKPAMLNKTLSSAAYSYACQNPPPKDPKVYRKEDGSVATKQRNICANPLSKITQQKMKSFKYTQSPYDNEKKIRNQQLNRSIQLRRGEGPFRAGSPVKQFFSTNVQAFNDHEIKRKQKCQSAFLRRNKTEVAHEGAFRPNCRPMAGFFSYPQHMPEKGEVKLKKASVKKYQAFKLPSKPYSSKPTPSIAYSMINLIGKLR